MWQLDAAVAEQRLKEMYDDAAVRRMVPRPPRRARSGAMRRIVGRALLAAGERLIPPVETPVAR